MGVYQCLAAKYGRAHFVSVFGALTQMKLEITIQQGKQASRGVKRQTPHQVVYGRDHAHTEFTKRSIRISELKFWKANQVRSTYMKDDMSVFRGDVVPETSTALRISAPRTLIVPKA